MYYLSPFLKNNNSRLLSFHSLKVCFKAQYVFRSILLNRPEGQLASQFKCSEQQKPCIERHYLVIC